MRRSARLVTIGSIALSVACGSPAAPAPTEVPTTTAVAPSALVPEITQGRMDPDVPGAALVVTMDRVTRGTDAALLSLTDGRFADADVRGGANGFLVPSLVDALGQGSPTDPPVVLEIDPRVPYRTLARVIYSVGQTNRTEMRLRVRRGTTLGVLPVSLPSMQAALLGSLGPSSADVQAVDDALRNLLGEEDPSHGGEPLPTSPSEPATPPPSPPASGATEPVAGATDVAPSMTMWLREDGVRIGGVGGELAPGCERVEPGAIAVPRTAGAIDLAALGVCLARAHAALPEASLVMGSTSDGTFGELAQAMAIARGTDEAPLFTTTLLAVGIE